MEMKSPEQPTFAEENSRADMDNMFGFGQISPSSKGFMRLSGPCEYPVSWGIGTRLTLFAWLCGVLVPFCIVTVNLDRAQISGSFVMFGVIVFSIFFIHLGFLLLFAPHCVTLDSEGVFRVCVSPCKLPLYSFTTSDVFTATRVTWRQLVCTRFVGFPTDWTRTVEIRLKSGRRIVVSLRDPDEFIRSF